MKTKSKTSGWLAVVLFLLIPWAVIWRGYVLSVLWAWFVVPTFEAPALTVPAAIGVALVVGFLVPQTTKSNNEDESPTTRGITAAAIAVGAPAFALLMGWIVRGFM